GAPAGQGVGAQGIRDTAGRGSRERAKELLLPLLDRGPEGGHARFPRETQRRIQRTVEMATEVEQHVRVETHDGVGLIQLNRPEKMNAIGALTRQQLGEAIKQAERDDAVRVVVLTGSGRAFCSGADVTEMVAGAGMRTPEDVGNVLRNEYMPMLTRLRRMPKPGIAA